MKKFEDLPHVFLKEIERESTVIDIDDHELFDFVEDYLTEECDLEYATMQKIENQSKTVYRMKFPTGISFSALQTALKRLDPAKIEEIYKINNPS